MICEFFFLYSFYFLFFVYSLCVQFQSIYEKGLNSWSVCLFMCHCLCFCVCFSLFFFFSHAHTHTYTHTHTHTHTAARLSGRGERHHFPPKKKDYFHWLTLRLIASSPPISFASSPSFDQSACVVRLCGGKQGVF